jgi:hypothetical protein
MVLWRIAHCISIRLGLTISGVVDYDEKNWFMAIHYIGIHGIVPYSGDYLGSTAASLPSVEYLTDE